MNKKVNRFALLGVGMLTLSGCAGQTHTHTYGEYRYLNNEQHIRYCTKCDEDTAGFKDISNHNFDSGVITKEATHTSAGEKTFTCAECGFTKTEAIANSEEHTFNRKVATEAYFASPATCLEPAQYYYSCSCGLKGSETFGYGPTLEHNITNLSIKSDTSNKVYVAYDEYDVEGLQLEYTCSTCGTHDADMSKVVISYLNGGRTLRSGETKVIAHYEGRSIEVVGLTVNKATNYIEGLEDISIDCHDSFDLPKLTSRYGVPSISIFDKNGEEVTKSNYSKLESDLAPYVIKATVAADPEYSEVSVEKHIYVEHKLNYVPSRHGDICLCGQYALNNYYYDMTAGSIVSSDVSGLLAEKFNSTLEVIDINTGKAPDWEMATKGQYFDLGVTIDGELVHLPGLVGTRVVTTLDEINQYVRYSKSTVENDGYYILGSDININGEVVDYAKSDFTFDEKVPDTDKTYGWSYWANYSFLGTFDGRNHEISKVRIVDYGFLGCLGSNSLVKDLRMTHLYTGDTSTTGGLAYTQYNCTVSNVYMQYDYVASATEGTLAKSGLVIAYLLGNYAKQINVTLDCSGLDIGVAYSGAMLGYGTQWPLSYVNCKLYCKSYRVLGYTDYARSSVLASTCDGVMITLR